MKLFRLKVSDSRSSKDRSKYSIARYARDEESLMSEMKTHGYLNIHSVKEVSKY